MKPVKILVDSFADEALTNAQMINAREIVSRLDSDRFSVTMFALGAPAPQILARPNTRLIHLPHRLQTIPLFARFLFGGQDIVFYLKASPASRWYLQLRSRHRSHGVIIGTIESQTDWRDESITPQSIRLVREDRSALRLFYSATPPWSSAAWKRITVCQVKSFPRGLIRNSSLPIGRGRRTSGHACSLSERCAPSRAHAFFSTLPNAIRKRISFWWEMDPCVKNCVIVPDPWRMLKCVEH